MSTIRLSDETKEKLKAKGKKGDSYEDIIKCLFWGIERIYFKGEMENTKEEDKVKT